ncbi:MAG: hypothetical protein ABL907_15980 [Hyphomicrobium sp.]
MIYCFQQWYQLSDAEKALYDIQSMRASKGMPLEAAVPSRMTFCCRGGESISVGPP